MKSLRESEALRLFFVQKKEFSGKWRILKVIGKISTDTKGGKGGIAMELRRFQEELEEKILGEYAAKSSLNPLSTSAFRNSCRFSPFMSQYPLQIIH